MGVEAAMCDTIGRIHQTRGVFFAKNSDRHPTEVQVLERSDGSLVYAQTPRLAKYEPQFGTLTTAHATLSHPYRALISRPSWIWGSEMGVNENGVVIGNEAVFTKERPRPDGLLGMDIVRLALHNSATATEAVTFILELLTQWGQGGDGSFVGTLTYSNSFMIADPKELYVLETAAAHWAVKRIEGHASISNAYSLRADYDRSDQESMGGDFTNRWRDRLMEFFSKGRVRQQTTSLLLEVGEPSWMGMRDILLYNRGTAAKPDRTMRSIAIDASFPKPTRTTASMVIDYPANLIIAWCCPAPLCIYHPFFPMLINADELGKANAEDTYAIAERRQRLTQALLKAGQGERQAAQRSARELESGFEARLRPLFDNGDTTALEAAIDRCQHEAHEREETLCQRLGVR